jgi:HTH-type transcriptional regulator, quorum sensing regulator NprR
LEADTLGGSFFYTFATKYDILLINNYYHSTIISEALKLIWGDKTGMHKGKIIKHYRMISELTQEQLSRGICSMTHLSKMERGLTDCSDEIMEFLANRLEINMESEMAKFESIPKMLFQFHDNLILENHHEIELVKDNLEESAYLIEISTYKMTYALLKIRYLIYKGQMKDARKKIKKLGNAQTQMSSYDRNLYKHIIGILKLTSHDNVEAIVELQSIIPQEYPIKEYYLHLAMAYSAVGAKVKSYYYAELALAYFEQMSNFLGVIDAKSLMLIQRGRDNDAYFKKIIDDFNSVIKLCDMCKDDKRKAEVFHHIADLYYRKENYLEASQYYLKSLNLKPLTSKYLASLNGYANASYHGKLLGLKELEGIAKEGLDLSKKIQDLFHSKEFKLKTLLYKNKSTQYYKFIEENALPYFKLKGYLYTIQYYEYELFKYYCRENNREKATIIAEERLKYQLHHY